MDLLPISFQEKMKELLNDEFDSFIECFKEKHNCGMRVNTLKMKPSDFEKACPYEIERIPWINNGFYYNDNDQPAKHPYYYAGLYYIQEPSAMTPASLLPVVPGDKVLDLCAAPGGKTTELGAKLKGKGVLVSNDISNSRAKALLKNVELFGIRNGIVISEAPAKLTEVFEGYFDKILVDAPCSGEGMFRKSHSIIKNWEQYGTGYYAKLQREILPCAIKMLKPGGYMIYSTCTFSVEEDEATLKFILDNYPDMHVADAADISAPGFKGFVHGNHKYVDGAEEISKSIRIYPHKVRGEGHFVALLKKDDVTTGDNIAAADVQADNEYDNPVIYKNSYSTDVRKMHKDISDEAFDFLEKIGFRIDVGRLMVRDDFLYLLPEDIPVLKGLRVMRSGLLLGEIKKGRFEPSQALACALRIEEYSNIYNISSDDADVIRYLRCESIELKQEVSDGYLLVCCDNYPLGWGKVAGNRLKNKYLPGWRLM